MSPTLKQLHLQAEANLFNLQGNPYPGRGIIVGLDESATNLVQVYWITAKKKEARDGGNPILALYGNGRVASQATEPDAVRDPSERIYYNALQEDGELYIVSSGSQTSTLMAALPHHDALMDVLHTLRYEPDDPASTQRISANSFWRGGLMPSAWISRVGKSPWDNSCLFHLHEYDCLGAGFGYGVTTYAGDGDPPPPFEGEPHLLPLIGSIEQIADTYWGSLNEGNRLALAVKFISEHGGPSQVVLRNKYSKA